jgi:C4-dicarboxylate transporter DctQ subunit
MRWLRRTVELIDACVGRISAAAAAISCLAMLLITIGIAVNSLSRYAFNSPFLFVDEYAQYLLVVVFYFGVGYTLRAGRHVAVDMLVGRLSATTQRRLRVVVSLAGSVAIVLMCHFSWLAYTSTARSQLVSLTPLQTPLALPYLAVAIGMTIFALEIVVGILKDLVGRDRPVTSGTTEQHWSET